MWETARKKQAEKISDLVNSKTQLQNNLDQCKFDLQRLQTSYEEALDTNQLLTRQHSNSKAELQKTINECKADLQCLQTSHKEALDTNQLLISQHLKAMEDLKSQYVSNFSSFI